jgi:hypothetical protein
MIWSGNNGIRLGDVVEFVSLSGDEYRFGVIHVNVSLNRGNNK